MARTRNLKPSFFTNDTLAEIEPLGRLLFQGLWCHADRSGRLHDRPRKIKAEVLPYDDCDVDAALNELQALGFIVRYGSKEARFIQVVNFCKHQNPHVKEQASDIPAPDKYGASTVQEREEPSKSDDEPGLNPSSLNLNPSTLNLSPTQSADADKPDTALEVFDFWRKTLGHERSVLDAKRRKLINARLKDGYGAGDLCKSILGCSLSPYHMGQNDGGTRYDSLDLILRSADKVDQFMKYAESPPVPNDKNNGPPRMSHADQTKLAAARAIFGTEIEANNGTNNGRTIDVTPATRQVGQQNISGATGQLRLTVPEPVEDWSSTG